MSEYQKYCIRGDQTLRFAMKQLDETARKVLFVVEDSRLLGSLTDGDLRRFLLAGGNLDKTVYEAAFKKPRIAGSREDAVQALKTADFCAMPVLDNDGQIIDIVFDDEPQDQKYAKLDLPVVIQAGGKGTRLDPYTRVLPKPLIPVGELPIMEHILQRFERYGCSRFHVIINHKKQLIKAYFAENEHHYDIRWYDEEKPLGTGGGLAMLRGILRETFFLTNCDILLLSDLDKILQFHRVNHNAVTMVCAYKNVTIPYGVIETGENGAILAMKEKPEFSFQTNTGIYLVEPEILDDIQPGFSVGFPDIIEQQMKKGRRVAAYPVSENDWLDMGQHGELEKMRVRLYGE